MKRSEINDIINSAATFFEQKGWTLPPQPKWDVTDFGLGDLAKYGLVLVNLAEEVEYCEKLMYARKGQCTPCHAHKKKKEDIICRTGILKVQLWADDPLVNDDRRKIRVKINGNFTEIDSGVSIALKAGERVTLETGIWHSFYPESEQCIIGEVSTANDDLNDNFFSDPGVGRFLVIEEDEPALVKLLTDE